MGRSCDVQHGLQGPVTVIRCNVEDLAKFEYSLRAWGRGSNYVNLTDEQYAKLKR